MGFEKQKKNKKNKKKGNSSPKSKPETNTSTTPTTVKGDSRSDEVSLLTKQPETITSSVILGSDTTDVNIPINDATHDTLKEWDQDYEKLKEDILKNLENENSPSISSFNRNINDLKERAEMMKNDQMIDREQADLRFRKIEKTKQIGSYYKENDRDKKKKVIKDEKSLFSADTKLIVQEQDKFIGRISTDIESLTKTSKDINNEIAMQEPLLDNMNSDMEIVRNSILNETKHAERVNKNSSLCSLYFVILILFVVMVLLLVVGLR